MVDLHPVTACGIFCATWSPIMLTALCENCGLSVQPLDCPCRSCGVKVYGPAAHESRMMEQMEQMLSGAEEAAPTASQPQAQGAAAELRCAHRSTWSWRWTARRYTVRRQ